VESKVGLKPQQRQQHEPKTPCPNIMSIFDIPALYSIVKSKWRCYVGLKARLQQQQR
jgi:hypothetical protein